MHKLAIAFVVMAVVLIAGGLDWKADATTWSSGTLGLPAASKDYSPIEKVGCKGPGRWCPFGWHRVCGPWRCRCVPC